MEDQHAVEELAAPALVMPSDQEGEPFRWDSLVAYVLHPVQVQIIEAMWWIGRPLAALDLEDVFHHAYSLSYLDYHVRRLVALTALRKVGQESVRGATKNFYVLAS